MLPPPTLSFTIPSIHDDLPLQCRVYHPADQVPGPSPQRSRWRRKAAIVAHPYAPLGGCYDDPVVDIAGSTILKEGFIVGTFNFRGAGSSKGRTSWSSKPEQDDYLSFIGFMIYYMHHLSVPEVPDRVDREYLDVEGLQMHDLSPIPSHAIPPRHETPVIGITTAETPSLDSGEGEPNSSQPCLLLAGYSYGSMILSSLPPLTTDLLSPFQTPSPSSPHEEIRLRALHLATQQNDLLASYIHSLSIAQPRTPASPSPNNGNALTSPKLRKSNPSVRIGGDENSRRASHDSYRSRNSFSVETPEKLRRSIDRVRSIARPNRRVSGKRDSGSKPTNSTEGIRTSEIAGKTSVAESVKPVPDIIDDLKTAYILISPLQGIIHSLATMWTSPSTSSTSKPSKSSRHTNRTSQQHQTLPPNDLKLISNPTLAMFGDDDIFVSVKKLREWVRRLSDMGDGLERDDGVEGGGDAVEGGSRSRGKSRFVAREVDRAGHFWHGYEPVRVLREEVRGFARAL